VGLVRYDCYEANLFYHLRNPTQIISKPVKTIRYQDCFAQMFRKGADVSTATATGQLNAPFDLNISGYKKNVKYVALIPFAETSDGHFATAVGTPQYQSPFDSALGLVCQARPFVISR